MQFPRLFTQGSSDPYGLIHFRQPEAFGDSCDVPLEHPDGWSASSVELLAEAAQSSLPAAKKPMEENTVPSWLWQQSRAKSVGKQEASVCHIFDRVAGAAAYQGWKQKIFVDEGTAKNFFDETRYLLAQRFIGFEPSELGAFGLDWAYGVSSKTAKPREPQAQAIDIPNAMIDAVVSGRRDRAVIGKWNKIVAVRAKAGSVQVRFPDTEAQWEQPVESAIAVQINLLAFRHNDGSVNIDALRHAVRAAVLLVDLNCSEAPKLAIGFTNLASLLMALTLPYDSEAARSTAAAIAAIVTAESFVVSAELAALRGASPEFKTNREAVMRALRNHRRAAYGEHNDYEKMSVTPSPLALNACPDLALTAAARSIWDKAVESAQKQGLRYVQVTGFVASPSLALFMESDSEGIEPLRSLARRDVEDSTRAVHPSVAEALVRLGYDAKHQQVFARQIVGSVTLEKAPAINHVSLKARGFTAEALGKVEAYLPQAKNLRHVFTPWVVGMEFCHKILKIPASKRDDMRFNLLAYLGFSQNDISTANAYCYGHNKIGGIELLRPSHAAIFATSETMQTEAYVRMASAVQGLVSGKTALELRLPVGMPAERLEKLLLEAWRRGLKSLVITFDPAIEAEKTAAPLKITRRKIAENAFLHTKAPQLPKRRSRSGASRLGAAGLAKPKNRGFAKGH